MDPGTYESAYVYLTKTPAGYEIGEHGYLKNSDLEKEIERGEFDEFVIEDMANFGKGGKTVFVTLKWIGRFEATAEKHGKVFELFRKTVVSHITGSSQAGDPQVRAALIARYGAAPFERGGITGYDQQSALAIGTTHLDKRENNGD